MTSITLTTRTLNLVIRGVTAVLRLWFAIALATYLTPAEVGQFGLISATIAFSVLLSGGEVHTYGQREFVASPSPDQASVLVNQMVLGVPFIFLGLLAQRIAFAQGWAPTDEAASYLLLSR